VETGSLGAGISDITTPERSEAEAVAKAFGLWADCFAFAYEASGGEWAILVADDVRKIDSRMEELQAYWAGWSQSRLAEGDVA
jgi:hypothetical protein